MSVEPTSQPPLSGESGNSGEIVSLKDFNAEANRVKRYRLSNQQLFDGTLKQAQEAEAAIRDTMTGK